MKGKKMLKSVLSLIFAVSMIAGFVSISAEAEDNTFNYVTIGASNTNGYGIRGYITDEELNAILSGQVSKDDVNVYGYQRAPEGAYTDLVRDYYTDAGKTVNLSQLAISSMRVEEVRILLDDNYMGDDYSEWRFTGSDGWFRSAEEGGIEALRKAYRDSIANADLITVDIGWNNFGVYVCNQLETYLNNGTLKWSADINNIYDTEEERAAAKEAKEMIRAYIEANAGPGPMADVVTDIFSYSILGYMHNFDICMEKIYELNPDADVVVLGIQNLLHGVVCELGGQEIELGNIFGNFVNMANYYISACSPYQANYQFVKAGGDDEHVTLFLDDIKSYDGDAKNLNQNIKDCFDYYDNDLFIQTRVDYMAAAVIEQEFSADELSMIGCESGADAVALGKRGELNEGMGALLDVQATFDKMYWPALYAAYDTLAQLVSEVANLESVVVDGFLSGSINIGDVEDSLMKVIEAEIQDNALAAANGEAYTVDIDKILTDDTADIVAAMYVRFYMGNSFFAHPSEAGHKEIKDAIVGIINNPESEKDQPIKEELAQSVVQMQQVLCAARNHDGLAQVTTKEATCTEAGEKTTVCEQCGLNEKEEIKATGHNYKKVVTKATLKQNGKIEQKCQKCDSVKTQKIYYPKTIKLSKTSFVYNANKVQKPTVTVTDSNGKKIAAKNNYTVTFVNAKKAVGQYTVKIAFKGNYKGTATKTYKIVPKGTTISSLTKASKAITVKWKKQATQTTGYEIQMATDKSFTKNKKLTTVAKTATVSKKVTGLKANTKYFVRVRTYKTVKINGKSTKIYSAWSAVKNVKTK